MYLKGILIKFGPFIFSFLIFEMLRLYSYYGLKKDLMSSYVHAFKWYIAIALTTILITWFIQQLFKFFNKLGKGN